MKEASLKNHTHTQKKKRLVANDGPLLEVLCSGCCHQNCSTRTGPQLRDNSCSGLFGKMSDEQNGLEMMQVNVRHHTLSEQLSVLLLSIYISDWLFQLPLWLILYLGVNPSVPVLIEARELGTSQHGLCNPSPSAPAETPTPTCCGIIM